MVAEVTGYTILTLVGCVLVVVIARQIVAFRFEARREAAELALLKTKLETAQIIRERAKENAVAWSGWRKFRVDRKVFESDDVCSFYLVPHDRKALPPFIPGQYLTFQLDGIPNETKTAVRCYSLSDCYNPNWYRISVKRVPAPPFSPDAPPGLCSGFLHDHIEEGALLDVGAPNGNFAVEPEDSMPVVLIGGGIGVTPVLSMLNGILAASSQREVWFFYGVRTPPENILREHLDEVHEGSENHPNIRCIVCYSEELDPEKALDLKSYEKMGTRVTVELMKSMLPSSNYEFYTCGPGAMMKTVKQDLRAWGVPASSIHEEVFPGPPTKKAAASAEGIEVKVDFRKTGKEVDSPGDCATLLELAEKNDVEIPFACKVGSCGTCVSAILEGEVVYSQDPSWMDESELHDDGLCLPCICLAKTELVLDR